MGPWELSAAIRPDSWVAAQTYSTAFWTFSPYLPRPGSEPPDISARPASPVMPAPDEPSDQDPLRAWRPARNSRPLRIDSRAAGVISSPRTWLGWTAIPPAAGFLPG